ncbi:MAG: hypothetical protein ACJAV5_000379 [Vicingaceae bacterium]|jgi:hypothetical protein
MKKLLLLPFFVPILIGLQLKAQSYIPFPTSNAVWVNYENRSYGATNTNDCYTSRIFTAGDTTINNYSYTRLLRISETKTGNFGLPCNTVVQAATLDTLGYFRNDTAQKKVWLKATGIVNEILLYDFAMNIGDTIALGYFDDPTIPAINVVDSIYTENYGGIARTVYRIDRNGPCLDPKVYLIEGIGSKSGFLKPLGNCGTFGLTSVLCFSINGTSILVNNNVTMQPPCGLLTGIKDFESMAKGQVQISPNPAKDVVKITNAEGLERVEVYDAGGKLLQNFVDFDFAQSHKSIGSVNKIDLSNYEAGTYILKLIMKNGEVFSKKIIKQ